MKRTLFVGFALLSVFLLAATVEAQVSPPPGNADSAISQVNRRAGESGGEKVVTDRLAKEFKVTDAEVARLRSQGLGFGEVAIVFSLARELPGGITDANVQKVLALRQQKPTLGWGEIAKALGVKLGPAVARVQKVGKEAAKDLAKAEKRERKVEKRELKAQEKAAKAREKAEKRERIEAAERPERPEKAEKPERPEKPEKAERPERPEKPEGSGRR